MNDKLIVPISLACICLIMGIVVIVGVVHLQKPKVKNPEVILEKYEYGITCVDGIQYLYGNGHLIPYFTYDKISLVPKVRLCK